MSVPYAYIEAGWFIGGAALIGAGLGLIWKLVHP